MPGTPHRVVDDQAVHERPVVVRAVCADRKERITAPSEKNVVGIDAADNHPAVRKIRKWHAALEIAY